ncbi:MAG TPA: hypothetical protein VL524_18780 [Gemmatimonadaceae bacterium]|nr:hypothetical protein [Gemmatimonadaceae bacterium]
MPSDDRTRAALAALAPQLAAFRSVAIGALEHARAVLAPSGGVERVRLELGALGARVDPARFASIAGGGPALDATTRERIERAQVVLESLVAASDDAFVIDVPLGASVTVAVREALAHFGRVFGLASAVDLARSGRYLPELHDRAFVAWPFELWGARERRGAPPLVVRLSGEDMSVGNLADVLDGAVHVALCVVGEAAPARLVRLITPDTFVIQAKEPQALARFCAYGGPAVAALFEADVACFTHDPARGRALWQRLSIEHQPAPPGRKRVSALTQWQQNEELQQLVALATRPTLSETPVESLVPAGDGDPVDRLATWLLGESGTSQ